MNRRLRFLDAFVVGPENLRTSHLYDSGTALFSGQLTTADLGVAAALSGGNRPVTDPQVGLPPPTRALWRRLDVTSAMGCYLWSTSGECLGWLGVLRLGDQEPFSRGDLRRFRSLIQDAVGVCLHAQALDQRYPAPKAAVALVNDHGSVAEACPLGLSWWAEPANASRIKRLLGCLDPERPPASAWGVGSAAVRFMPLSGRAGTLLVIRPARCPQIGLLNRLTPKQTLTAIHAASGRSTDAISREMQVSAETVKAHLKAIYHALDMGSRAELARAIGATVR